MVLGETSSSVRDDTSEASCAEEMLGSFITDLTKNEWSLSERSFGRPGFGRSLKV